LEGSVRKPGGRDNRGAGGAASSPSPDAMERDLPFRAGTGVCQALLAGIVNGYLTLRPSPFRNLRQPPRRRYSVHRGGLATIPG
jgi:hypothetical protein